VHVRSLRRKLDRPGSPLPLETVRGSGYRLRSDNWSPVLEEDTEDGRTDRTDHTDHTGTPGTPGTPRTPLRLIEQQPRLGF
jgi:DNA-binding winged helix-turn-helix (wHTH) protein